MIPPPGSPTITSGGLQGDPRPGWRGTSTPSSTLRLGHARAHAAPPRAARSGHGETVLLRGGGLCAGQVEHVILEVSSEEEGSDWLRRMTTATCPPLSRCAPTSRADLRALYLGWLLCAQAGGLDDGEEEPPCPPGSAGSARRSRPSSRSCVSTVTSSRLRRRQPGSGGGPSGRGREGWVSGLPEAEKTALLVRLIKGDEPHLRAELVHRFRVPARRPRPVGSGTAYRRRAPRGRQAAR